MKSDKLRFLREKVNVAQAVLAEELGVTIRTVSTWEQSDKKEFTSFEVKALKEFFRAKLFEDKLRDRCKEVYTKIPSEMVSVWLVDQGDCILLPKAHYLHSWNDDTNEDVKIGQIIAPLWIRSLTTYPLRSGEVINVAGDHILKHPAKKYKKHRVAKYVERGFVESLLHIPQFVESANGPTPVCLLCLQNKLDSDRQVIIPQSNDRTIYTENDFEVASNLAKGIKDEIIDDMALLEMIIV